MDGSAFRKDALAFLLSLIILPGNHPARFNIRGKKRPNNIIRNISSWPCLPFS